MKKILFLAAVAAMGFTSCSQDEIVTNPAQQKAIEFGTYLGKAPVSRAAAMIAENLNGFGVFAIYTNDAAGYATTTGTDATATFNFMTNEPVSKSGQTWGYTNTKYWPTGTNEKISFFAYSPYDATNESSTGTVVFNLSSTIASQVDFLYDNQQINKTATTDPITFNFKHALSRLGIKVTSDVINGSTVTVESVKLGDGTNSYFKKSGNFNVLSGVWANTTDDDTKISFSFESSVFGKMGTDSFTTTNTITTADGDDDFVMTQDDQYLMLIPQTFTNLPITVTYKLKAADTDVELSYTATKYLNETLEQGKQYLLNITVSPQGISFAAPTVVDWTTATTNEETPINAGEKVESQG